MSSFTITGRLADVHTATIYPACITVNNGRIESIAAIQPAPDEVLPFILPGFIDSHVHIESSMLVPSEFARLAVVHGTVATISDPHEIANVCGMEGVEFMIENGKTVPFKFNFGAPSCVPATVFETAGATLTAADVEKLLQRKEIRYLSEMMNFPGVLQGDEEVMKKIHAAIALGKPVDGHAPGLRGDEARKYAEAGSPGKVVISTDHECFTREEALDKLQAGMKILIREGSAARNFDALIPLLHDYPDHIMFCSDDKHPDSLVMGHIDQLCARAVKRGIPLFHILKAACVNPVLHYQLDAGLLREGDAADFIVVEDLEQFRVLQTYINGQLVAENGVSRIQTEKPGLVNQFSCTEKKPADFEIRFLSERDKMTASWLHLNGPSGLRIPVIEALDGQLITNRGEAAIERGETVLRTNVKDDILKIVVVNRYKNAPVAKAFIKNFGLKSGAMASSVAHDSHNIVAVGVDDESICRAVNKIIEAQGGISAVTREKEMILPLPVAGLMSDGDGYRVAEDYTAIDCMAREMGSTLSAPFMTLSFMALLVIPHLKLSDRGLFDGDRFELIN